MVSTEDVDESHTSREIAVSLLVSRSGSVSDLRFLVPHRHSHSSRGPERESGLVFRRDLPPEVKEAVHEVQPDLLS